MADKMLSLQDVIGTAETNLEKSLFTVEAVESSLENLLALLHETLKMQGMGTDIRLGLDIVEDYILEVQENITKAKKLADEIKREQEQA